MKLKKLSIKYGCDTNNNIMGPKNKNSQTMEKVKRTAQLARELYMLKDRRRDRVWNVSSPLLCY